MIDSPLNKLCKRRAVAGAVFVILLMVHSSAFGHARLVRSQPAANSTSRQAPKIVELWFSEDLEPTMSTIIVTDQSGKRVDKNNATAAEGNKKLQIDLEDLGSGTFTVEWKALATDQHTMKGKFAFNVSVAEKASNTSTPIQTPNQSNKQPAQIPSPLPQAAESTEESGSTWMMSLVRWLQYLSMMSLVGGSALRLLVLGPALRADNGSVVTGKSDALVLGQRRILFLSWASVVLLLITIFIALVQQASAVFDKTLGESLSPSVLGEVLTKTGYGGAWFLQVGTAFALVIILLLLGLGLRRAPAKEHTAHWWAALLVGVVLLVAPSWTGHAAAAIKDFRLAVVTDWLHLVAGAFWVGGLFHLAFTTRPILRVLDRTKRAGVLHQIVRLFTKVAIPTVAVLVLAGLYNTWVHVDSFGALWSTAYGRTLLLKLMLVVLMLALGGVNNFHFGKKAARLSESQEGDVAAQEHSKLEQGFSRSVMLEAAFGVAVLLVTAILVFQTPARSHPVMTSGKAESTLVQTRK
ncbi:MAG: copper resistance protein CopC/CopD [Acidobacteriota bacterium]|nr:copper resistance protein CopC/CopD [Acidobacteriota bacterium]